MLDVFVMLNSFRKGTYDQFRQFYFERNMTLYRKSPIKCPGRLLNFGGLWGERLFEEGRLLDRGAYLIS